ncbi:haloacid dehalogenase-like hydrolase (HAD) superfamily protein [Actinidia rufa]|uniref:Mitochondrial import inner membrane translocase subunit TIM50 n=1 Tax=Actinidia rufa TaxID=165716 RepID=A0A7J0E9E9_9ERIC|nr:haloacid dehalogenase-like hydrolase (HAD) superfamily protein [Actinidia rufa]
MEEKNEKFEHEMEQALEILSIDEQKNIKVTLADSKSERKHRSYDLDATKRACLAVLNKEDYFLEVSNPSPGRAPVACLRRKLLVLDINGLLADIVSPPPKECKADTNILRRATMEFLLFDHHLHLSTLSIAKTCAYALHHKHTWLDLEASSVSCLFQLLNLEAQVVEQKMHAGRIIDLSHCTGTGCKTLENKHKELVFKELRKLWENHDSNLPWEKGDYNESNTLLLDDSPYKALLNPVHTAIFPYSYNFKNKNDNSLGPEGDIRIYLRDLAEAEDVQKYVEEHPFGQMALDETSSSWDYYHRFISRHSLVLSSI